jgi:hypothetical protein
MGRLLNKKCLACSALDVNQAKQQYGTEGDNCWDDSRCHKRRSHYRHRGERNATRVLKRQLQQQVTQPQLVHLCVSTPPVSSAVLILYSEHPDNFKDGIPIHAIGAELWIENQRQAQIEPIHCFGMRGDKVTALLPQILEAFSEYVGNGKRFTSFSVKVHRHVRDCPLRPCPFHPD